MRKFCTFMILLLLLTSCSLNPQPIEKKISTEEVKKDPLVLTIQHTQVGESNQIHRKILEEIAKEIENEVSGIKVVLQEENEVIYRHETLPDEMERDIAPDIFEVFGTPDLKYYASKEKVLDLAEILKELELNEKFGDLHSFRDGNKIYGLPFELSANGFFYRKDYFQEKKLVVPKNLTDLEFVLEFIKQDSKTPIAAASKSPWVPLMLVEHIWTRLLGTDANVRLQKSELKWTDPKMEQAWNLYLQWNLKGYFFKGELGYEYDQMLQQFSENTAILMFDHTSRVAAFQEENLKENIGFFTFPPYANQEAIMVQKNRGYAVSRSVLDNPKKLQAIKIFLNRFFNTEVQMQLLIDAGILPALKIETQIIEEKIKDPLLKEIALSILNASSTFPSFDAVLEPEVRNLVETSIQKLIEDQIEIPWALLKIQEEQEHLDKERENSNGT